MIGLGGNYSKSEQKSDASAESGFVGYDKNRASAAAMDGLNNLFTSADDLYRNKAIPQFNMSKSMPGLFDEQVGAMDAYAKKMFANASAGGALRGGVSINNTPAIVGSAITNMGSTLLPIISNNLKDNMLLPEQIRTQRFNNVMSPLQALIAGLGSKSEQHSQGSGFGVGGNIQAGSGGGGGGGLG